MSEVAGRERGRDEWVRRAAELVPLLAERAQETERRRRLPEETVRALADTGLQRVANPEGYGGYGLDYDVALEVGAELGRGCGSTAWCYTVWSSHRWLLGLYPRQAQEDYFADGPDTIASAGFNVTQGRAERADGGYLLWGHWDFSSGCDAAAWLLLAAAAPDQGPGLFLVPRAACDLVDTWFASGLRGTGSNDVVLERPVFVPAHRFLSFRAMGEAATPGRRLHDRATYRVPSYCVLPFTLAAPLIGMAQGMVEAFQARMSARPSAVAGQRMAELPALQERLGEATAEVDCARLLMRRDLAELIELGGRGADVGARVRFRCRRDHGYIGRLCLRAVNRLFEVSGGHTLFDTSALQRLHRDVHAGSHQVGLVWYTRAQDYGRLLLGLEPQPPLL